MPQGASWDSGWIEQSILLDSDVYTGNINLVFEVHANGGTPVNVQLSNLSIASCQTVTTVPSDRSSEPVASIETRVHVDQTGHMTVRSMQVRPGAIAPDTSGSKCRNCCVAPLTAITDAAALRFEEHK